MNILVRILTPLKKSLFKGNFEGCEGSHYDEKIKWFCDTWPFSL